jgi:hypothetical protein
MKNLMESTFWRFKVAFAGLHNVRRLAQAPISPLVHLGDPICIGEAAAGRAQAVRSVGQLRRATRHLLRKPTQGGGCVRQLERNYALLPACERDLAAAEQGGRKVPFQLRPQGNSVPARRATPSLANALASADSKPAASDAASRRASSTAAPPCQARSGVTGHHSGAAPFGASASKMSAFADAEQQGHRRRRHRT